MTTTYAYDPNTFRITRLTSVRASDGATLQDLTYTYDVVGNIVRKQDDAQQVHFFANNLVDATEVYVYDAVGRLISGTGRERIANDPMGPGDPVAFTPVPASNDPQAVRRYEQTFTYDESGNLTYQSHWAGQANSWNRTLSYATGSNALVQTTQAGTTDTYDYNARGGMTRLPHLHNGSTSGAINVVRDFRNQMVGALVNATTTASYGRDGGGQRVRKRVVDTSGSGTVEERLYLGDAEVYRKSVGGTLQLERWTLHVSDGSGRVDIIETKTMDGGTTLTTPVVEHRVQLMDHLGNSVTEVDASAAIISAEAYYPYGSCAWWLGSSQAEVKRRRYRYTGKERDEETGLQDHGARMYAPWLCRWLSADPAWFVDGPNRWQYVRSSPIMLDDPSGLGTPNADGTDVELIGDTAMTESGVSLGLSQAFGTLRDGATSFWRGVVSTPELLFGGNTQFEKTETGMKASYSMPENGVGGVVGGTVHTATFRLWDPREANPGATSSLGFFLGTEMLPVLSPANRLVYGSYANGQDASRAFAAAQMGLDLFAISAELNTFGRAASAPRLARSYRFGPRQHGFHSPVRPKPQAWTEAPSTRVPLPGPAPGRVASLPADQGPILTDFWPPRLGFDKIPRLNKLQPGTLVDRFGYDGGTFVAPLGTPFSARALPAYKLSAPYRAFVVTNEIPVLSGPSSPWFGQPGLGTQYELPVSVERLIGDGFLAPYFGPFRTP